MVVHVASVEPGERVGVTDPTNRNLAEALVENLPGRDPVQSAGKDRGLVPARGELGGEALRDKSPADPEAQSAVGELRRFITENYYTCTPEILRGLGEMYVGDGRFKANIDAAGGEGTAEFVSEAIKIYCDNQ